MKIKMTKKMRLDELIKYIFDNDEANRVFIDDGEDFAVHTTSSDADVNIEHLKGYGGKKCISKRDTFTVEVEEELTEDTEIHGATLIYYNELKREVKTFRYADVTPPSLKRILRPRSDTVALAVFKGKQLIWTKEHGIPESGVVELME